MPSPLHEALVSIFRSRPSLAPTLLREALGIAIPPFDEVRIESAELGDVVPPEYRADVVVVLARRGDLPVLAIAVEVQLGPDARKRFTWPVYATSLRARHGCDAAVLVVAPDEEVARWADAPIAIGPAGCAVRPIVLGPGHVPIVRDLERARGDPELALLSAIAHGRDPLEVALPIATAAVLAAAPLDEERCRLYIDLVLSRLGDATRRAVEELLMQGKYEYQSDFARRFYGQGMTEGVARGRAEGVAQGRAEGVAQGRAEGVAQGRAEGVAQGRAEGVAQGRALGLAEAVLELLSVRGVEVSEALRAEIAGCQDAERLSRWLRRAANATRGEDVID